MSKGWLSQVHKFQGSLCRGRIGISHLARDKSMMAEASSAPEKVACCMAMSHTLATGEPSMRAAP